MHKILVNTHKESNINILKARDYYFDKARFYNNRLCKMCLVFPIAVSVLCMFAGSVLNLLSLNEAADVLETYTEFIVGCLAILSFIVDSFLKDKIGEYLSKSNALRELYDVKVLGITPNDFYYHYSEEEINELLEVAKYETDKDKYEVWYREMFSKSDFSNAICAMMDNIIYTYHVYSENRKQTRNNLIVISVVFALYCILWSTGQNIFVMVNPFVLFLAIFDYVKDCIDAYYTSKELGDKNKQLKESVVHKADELLQNVEQQELILRCIQDVVIDNRESGLFISKKVRNKFLENDNPYYKDLDYVKQLFWGMDVEKPEKAKEFQICSVEDENVLTDFEQIHNELITMLEDIKLCLEQHQISFMLDGGTLIGCCRRSNQNRFLEWDDDIDISIKSSDASKVIQVLREQLGDRYEIQDYESEAYYSPRLSRLRVRQKNTVSKVAEKDSELYELYESQGLFIDIYAYCPILVNKIVDSLYRVIFIHPLYKRIRKVESDWKYGRNPEKALKLFVRLKKTYMRRRKWYIMHAKNTDYVCYEPHYIDNLKKPGPYLKVEDVYGEKTTKLFEGKEYEVPSNYEAVLSAFYGKDWEKSPLVPLEELKKDEQGNIDSLFYSKATFDATLYKHLKKVSIYK